MLDASEPLERLTAREIAKLVEGSEAAAYASLIAAPAPELRAHYGLASTTAGSALAILARTVTSSLNLNRVIGLGVMEPASEPVLDGLAEFYGRHGLSFGVELSPRAQPPQLVEWLRARRLRKVMTTAIQYRAAEPIAAQTATPVHVTRAGPSECTLVADICCAVFGMPAAAHAVISATGRLPQWRQWLAYDDAGVAVAAALSFVESGVGWLGWDATLPQGRGRGAQTALIASRVTEAALAGCRFVTAETATHAAGAEDPSRRNYRRSGFAEAYERATYVRRHAPPG